jgi:hypothetical protein
MIDMSAEHYNDFLTKCRDTWLLEAAILNKGVAILQKDIRLTTSWS